MKIRAFWHIALCSFVLVEQRFTRSYCFHHQGDDGGFALVMEAVRPSETSVYYNETALCYIPEDFNLIFAAVRT
jgi:hypothetical protein